MAADKEPAIGRDPTLHVSQWSLAVFGGGAEDSLANVHGELLIAAADGAFQYISFAILRTKCPIRNIRGSASKCFEFAHKPAYSAGAMNEQACVGRQEGGAERTASAGDDDDFVRDDDVGGRRQQGLCCQLFDVIGPATAGHDDAVTFAGNVEILNLMIRLGVDLSQESFVAIHVVCVTWNAGAP